MNKLDRAVHHVPDEGTNDPHDTWTFECPGVAGDPCGPFRSTGWPTKKSARERGEQHMAEHHTSEPMQPLHEFREERGLFVDATGRVLDRVEAKLDEMEGDQ